MGKEKRVFDHVEFFIPKQTKLYNQVIEIRYIKNLKGGDGEELDGLSCFRPDIIFLNKFPYDLKQEELTYLHELVHIILGHMSEFSKNSNEKFVSILSNALHQYLITAKYGSNWFIPMSFTIFGQRLKVVWKKLDSVLSKLDREKNICYMNTVSETLAESIIVSVSHTKYHVAFLNQLMYFILHMSGERVTRDNTKFIMQFSYLFHQAITEATND